MEQIFGTPDVFTVKPRTTVEVNPQTQSFQSYLTMRERILLANMDDSMTAVLDAVDKAIKRGAACPTRKELCRLFPNLDRAEVDSHLDNCLPLGAADYDREMLAQGWEGAPMSDFLIV